MLQAVRCGIAVGSHDLVRRWSSIGNYAAVILRFEVFNRRSPIAILPRGQHVLRHVYGSFEVLFVLGGSLRLFHRRCYRSRIDGNMLLHCCKAGRGELHLMPL